MNKIKYLFNRIINMNYKNFFTIINKVNKQTGKNKIIIFFDMIYCGFRYTAGYMDYHLFAMYNMNHQERKTIITRGVNNNYTKALNDKEASKLLNDKVKFNEKFKKYLGRDFLALNNNEEEFKEFIEKHPEVIIKPTNLQCGQGIEKIKINPKDYKKVYNKLLNTGQTLIEEIATQCETLNNLHPYSINTMRIITIRGKVVAAYLRIGNHKNVADNFNNGGMVTPINIETGLIEFKALDKNGTLYDKHPITKTKIVGTKIPNWLEVVKYVEKTSKLIQEVGYVGWDVCLTKQGPTLIEANEMPGHDIYQLPPHRNGNIGLKPVFDKAFNQK